MRFSICLPTIRAATVSHTIASIRAQSAADWELLVIAQGDSSGVRAAVERAAGGDRRIRYHHIDRRGLSGARNFALRAARGDVLAMLDDDCEAAPDWLEVLGGCFDEEPGVGLVGGALVPPPPNRRGPRNCPSATPGDAVYDPVADHRHAPSGWDWVGGNFALRRELADRVGDFDVWLGAGSRFPACEDTDYKLRVEALGVRMRTTPRAVVHHTFGWRYGIGAVLRHQRDYARGNGAMAAKLTLLGDARGLEWRAEMRRDCLGRWYRGLDAAQLPAGLGRWRHFAAGYRECLTGFRVDDRGLLTTTGTETASPGRRLTR